MIDFKEIKNFLNHPIVYIVEHSQVYIDLKEINTKFNSVHDGLIDNYTELAGKFHIQREQGEESARKIENLESKVESNESEIISLQENTLYLEKDIVQMQEENCFMQREVDKHRGYIKKIKKDVEKSLKDHQMIIFTGMLLEEERLLQQGKEISENYKEIREFLGLEEGEEVPEIYRKIRDIRSDEMFARAEENSDSSAYNDWIRVPRTQLEDKCKVLEKQNIIFEGFSYGGRVYPFINQDSNAKKFPIAFYDFDNKEFYYNDKAKDLLEFKENSGVSYLSLGGLFRKIKNDLFIPENSSQEIHRRRYLLNILESGKILDDFEFNMIRKTKKQEKLSKLYLTTRPIHYVSKCQKVKRKKSFGILMFFSQPSIFHMRKGPIEHSKQYDEILSSLKDRFDVIYKAIDRNAPKNLY